MWLRSAPGFSLGGVAQPAPSDVQSGDAVNDHDPFDTRKVDAAAFRLIPLIYSFGPDGKAGVSIGTKTHVYSYTGNPYWSYTDDVTHVTMYLGSLITSSSSTDANTAYDNITNHHIEQR
jgi:hypothetical protein